MQKGIKHIVFLSLFIIATFGISRFVSAATCEYNVDLQLDGYQMCLNGSLCDPNAIGAMERCNLGWNDFSTVEIISCSTLAECETAKSDWEQNIGVCDAYPLGTAVGKVTSVGDVYSTGDCVVPAPSVSLSASPSSVPWYGGTTVLSWSASNADSCTASGDWSGSKSANGGSESVYIWPLSGDQLYAISCTGPGGSDSAALTVGVGSRPVEPVFDACTNMEGTQSSVPSGYHETSPGICEADVADMCPNISGTQASVPSGKMVNAQGECVDIPPAPAVSLSASPSSVPWYGGTTQVSWSVSNADSCTASGDWSGSKSANGGSESIYIWPLSGDQLYAISCTSPGGSDSAAVNVLMGAAESPVVNPPATCTDPGALNNGQTGDCQYPPNDDSNGGGNASGGSEGSGDEGAPVPSGFTVDGDSSVPIATLSALGGESKPAQLFVNPAGSFEDPVVLRVASARTANGAAVPSSAIQYSWNGGSFAPLPSTVLTFVPASGQYVGTSGLFGAKLTIKVIGKMTEKYFITVMGESGSSSDSHTIELTPKASNPQFQEL